MKSLKTQNTHTAVPRYLAEAEGAVLVSRRDRYRQMLQVLENSGLGKGKNAADLRKDIERLGHEINAKQAEIHQQNRTVVKAMLATFAAADLLADITNDLERAFKSCCVFNAVDSGMNFVQLAREASATAAKLVALVDEAGVLSVSNAYAEMADPITDDAARLIRDRIADYMTTYKGKLNF